jgi:hypothetical protein
MSAQIEVYLLTTNHRSWPPFIHERGRENRLGGVVISELVIGLRVREFNPSRGDGFLRAIKICSTPSFGGDVKPSAQCRKILRHVKNHFEV